MKRSEVINYLEAFMSDTISALELREWYFPKYQLESLHPPDREREVYSALFLDLDEYLPEEFNHLRRQFDIDITELRKRIVEHLKYLKQKQKAE